MKTTQPNFTSVWSVRWSIWWLLKRSLPRSTFAIWLQLWIIWRLCTVVILGWNLSIVSIKVMWESVNMRKQCNMFRIKVTMRTQKKSLKWSSTKGPTGHSAEPKGACINDFLRFWTIFDIYYFHQDHMLPQYSALQD